MTSEDFGKLNPCQEMWNDNEDDTNYLTLCFWDLYRIQHKNAFENIFQDLFV